MERHELADLVAKRAATGRPYLEFVRSDSMSVGLYVLPAGSVDGQLTPAQDEVYVVVAGTARFTACSAKGSVIALAARTCGDSLSCWESLQRADFSPFKNQGDCIQYANTGK